MTQSEHSEVKPVGLAFQGSHCSDTGWPLVCFWEAVRGGSPIQITSRVLFLFPSPLPLSQGTCVPGVGVDNTHNLHCFVSNTLFTGEKSPQFPPRAFLGAVALQAGGENALLLFHVFHLSLPFGSLSPTSFWVVDLQLS